MPVFKVIHVVTLDEDTMDFIERLMDDSSSSQIKIVKKLRKITRRLRGVLDVIDERFDTVDTTLQEIKMTMNADTQALLQRFDDATNKIATKLQALSDKADAQGSLTAAEINAALTPEIEKLEGFAKDPDQPIPEETSPGETTQPLET